MRNLLWTATALVVMLTTANSGTAQTNTWTANFPKAVAPAGSFEVDGTAVADVANGWALTGLGVVTYYQDGMGGGIVYTSPITVNVNTGKWNATVPSALGAGVKVVVIVQATEKKGSTQRNIATPSKTVTP